MQNRFIALAFLGTILGTLLITGCSQETRQQEIVQSDASSNSVADSSLLDGRPNLMASGKLSIPPTGTSKPTRLRHLMTSGRWEQLRPYLLEKVY